MTGDESAVFTVLVDWGEWTHSFRVTCDRCGVEKAFTSGMAMDWQRVAVVEWMIDHRREHVGV